MQSSDTQRFPPSVLWQKFEAPYRIMTFRLLFLESVRTLISLEKLVHHEQNLQRVKEGFLSNSQNDEDRSSDFKRLFKLGMTLICLEKLVHHEENLHRVKEGFLSNSKKRWESIIKLQKTVQVRDDIDRFLLLQQATYHQMISQVSSVKSVALLLLLQIDHECLMQCCVLTGAVDPLL